MRRGSVNEREGIASTSSSLGAGKTALIKSSRLADARVIVNEFGRKALGGAPALPASSCQIERH